MNKEEKEAIEIVKEIRKSDLMYAEFDIEELYNAIQTTLNLIDKLQKDSISKDKIKDKIKELEEELIQNYGTLGESLTTSEIKVLKELLGE